MSALYFFQLKSTEDFFSTGSNACWKQCVVQTCDTHLDWNGMLSLLCVSTLLYSTYAPSAFPMIHSYLAILHSCFYSPISVCYT